MKTAVGTIVEASYIPFARVLAASLQEHHPDVFCYVLVPGNQGSKVIRDESYQLIEFGEVGIPDLNDMLRRYDAQQVVIATKPFLLRHLLDLGYERVVFLDADILVMGDLSVLLTGVAPITLIPHHLHPLDDPERELQVLYSGTFNAGVVAVEESRVARDFLRWWGRRLCQYCHHDREVGLHFDQRWLDLAPALFEGVEIQRDPRIDVAYWNLPERRGIDPALFHFSGFDPRRPDMVTKHAPGLTLADIGEAAPLFRCYAERLEEAGWSVTTIQGTNDWTT